MMNIYLFLEQDLDDKRSVMYHDCKMISDNGTLHGVKCPSPSYVALQCHINEGNTNEGCLPFDYRYVCRNRKLFSLNHFSWGYSHQIIQFYYPSARITLRYME